MSMSYKMKRLFFTLTVKAKHVQKVKAKKIKELGVIEKELKVARKILFGLQFHGFTVKELYPLEQKLDLIKEDIEDMRRTF